ncbi:MAG TPA: Stealth CR1 domain-containing protein [Globicatella sulfidifaciens]|uniref:Stealth CR1 domain-containing protein n=1 Tax=Limosilactobacillus reuteri TaxID=1598 RepID=UPI0019581AE9|nr:Stealth CR1 domain-containing protein [Limosilactobacillus reuteri]MBM6813097.1 Stealth CR1 domain-containing protein [Limosilactobacillus reuteri]HJF17311.1 Stealth CR1 domain-containing protein [Globicatella sulfidifaciens]
MFKIDFVVTWVDGSDPNWIKEKNRYSTSAGVEKKGMNSVKAFREWGTFKYWFRGVQKFAPWVNKVYLVTYHQKPEWINTFNDKLIIVDHSEFLDHNNLPVFSANPIEVNLHRITGLSEHFVFFNDDMYLTAPVSPTDFFSKEGLPKYTTALSPIIPERYGTGNFQVNDMEIITDHFSRNIILKNGHFFSYRQGLKNIIKTLMYKNSKFICGFFENHLPYPMLKTTMRKVWEKEGATLLATSSSKFRSKSDVNIWLFKYWQIASGNYVVGNPHLGKLFTLDDAGEDLWNLINSGKYQIMCCQGRF